MVIYLTKLRILCVKKGSDSDSSRKVESLVLPTMIASLLGIAAFVRFSSKSTMEKELNVGIDNKGADQVHRSKSNDLSKEGK